MQPTVFFAIPCGEFYRLQSKIIEEVCGQLGIIFVIEEHSHETNELWRRIAERIDDADFFVADLSGQRQNIALELGYALARKRINRVGMFTSSAIRIPSDLAGFKCPQYSSLSEFRKQLRKWLASALNRKLGIDEGSVRPSDVFTEDFMNQDWFLRRWFTPPGSSWHLSAEGLRLTQAHFPIQTTTLGLLKDYEFEFKARIDKRCIGWTVQTTMEPDGLLPSFCVMFQLDTNDSITPYIWNQQYPTSVSYQAFQVVKPLNGISKRDGWFTLITRVKGEVIEIEHEHKLIFSQDFTHEPFTKWNGFPNKRGNVGFRCYLDRLGKFVEESTVREAKVRELT